MTTAQADILPNPREERFESSSGESVQSLHQVLQDLDADRAMPRLYGVVIGQVVGQADDGRWLVDFDGNPLGKLLPVKCAANTEGLVDGQRVALMFEQGDPGKPILIGPIHEFSADPETEVAIQPSASELPFNAQVDDDSITLTADKQIVLRCGKSSITLTRAGKILFRGAYLLSRSSGVNRIKGGSVQIN